MLLSGLQGQFQKIRLALSNWIHEWRYAGLLAVATVALAALLVLNGYRLAAPIWFVVTLAAIALVAEQQSVRVAAQTEMSVSVLPILFAAVLYGPLAAMIVGAAAILGDLQPPFARWLAWTSHRALVAACAGVVAAAINTPGAAFGVVVAAVAAAAATEAGADIVLSGMTASIRRRGPRETMLAMLRLQLGAVPLYAPVLGLLAFAYRSLSPWTALMFFIPALAAQRLFILYQEQRRLTEDVSAAKERLERANVSFATALVVTLDARDRYTAGHSAAVAIYARDIAGRMGLPHEMQQRAHLCGLVHDIGKIGLAAGLLEKAGPLTLEERRQMQTHSAIGARCSGGRATPPRTRRWRGVPRRPSRRADSASVTDHRGR
jgi:hypothetical protein